MEFMISGRNLTVSDRFREYAGEKISKIESLGDKVQRVDAKVSKETNPRQTPGELTVSAQTPDVGEASESLPVAFQGEPLEIGFNPDFLRDGLGTV